MRDIILQGDLFPDMEKSQLSKAHVDNSKRKWTELKNKDFGLEFCSTATFCGKYGIPKLDAYFDDIPSEFITLSEIQKHSQYSCGVTCFDYDYILESLWATPKDYIDELNKFSCFVEPDFSLKVLSPLAVQIANTYRSHVVAYYMQEKGIKVLPSMSWSTSQSYEFCFDGHSKGGAVMVSTIGTLRDERSRMFFKSGFLEMLKRISPDAVILYGDCNEGLISWMPKSLHVSNIAHNRFNRARRHGR